jgi:hypothetical protein
MITFDTSEVRRLAADLGAIPPATMPQVRAVLQKGALNIKNDWRQRWTGLSHVPALPYSITYDTTILATSARAEIGPDPSKRQGPLDNILEFGSINNAPHPGGGPALASEAPKFEKALADVLGDLVEGR